MDSRSSYGLASLLFLLITVAETAVFDVTKYGAVPNSASDQIKAFQDAWKAACTAAGPEKSTFLVPKGVYLVGPINFDGPCKVPMEFNLQGTIKADPDPTKFKLDWISFNRITGINLLGGGTIDGQGQKAWTVNTCGKSNKLCQLPISVRFNFLTNAFITGITAKDSKMFHINVMGCKNITFQGFTVTAPETSLNTDGIHVGESSQVKILDSNIATGDDCVSIGPGTVGMLVEGVTCGPGHGISIGSLGQYPDETPVDDVHVKNCTLINTMNGVRIKSWINSRPMAATNIIFEDITMDRVGNPIIIDQVYCPWDHCSQDDVSKASKVKISHVKFHNIKGTTKTKVAINIVCSKGIPCEDVNIGNVNLAYNGADGPAIAVVNFTNPILTGTQIPSVKAASAA